MGLGMATQMKGLKFRVNPSLLQSRNGGEAFFCTSIHCKGAGVYRAKPDFMITLAMPHKSATVIEQDTFQVPIIFAAHQAAIGMMLS